VRTKNNDWGDGFNEKDRAILDGLTAPFGAVACGGCDRGADLTAKTALEQGWIDLQDDHDGLTGTHLGTCPHCAADQTAVMIEQSPEFADRVRKTIREAETGEFLLLITKQGELPRPSDPPPPEPLVFIPAPVERWMRESDMRGIEQGPGLTTTAAERRWSVLCDLLKIGTMLACGLGCGLIWSKIVRACPWSWWTVAAPFWGWAVVLAIVLVVVVCRGRRGPG